MQKKTTWRVASWQDLAAGSSETVALVGELREVVVEGRVGSNYHLLTYSP